MGNTDTYSYISYYNFNNPLHLPIRTSRKSINISPVQKKERTSWNKIKGLFVEGCLVYVYLWKDERVLWIYFVKIRMGISEML